VPHSTADAEGRSLQTLDLPEAEVVLYPAFFSASEADRLLRELRDTTAWRLEAMFFDIVRGRGAAPAVSHKAALCPVGMKRGGSGQRHRNLAPGPSH
jgi:hypothetical protein